MNESLVQPPTNLQFLFKVVPLVLPARDCRLFLCPRDQTAEEEILCWTRHALHTCTCIMIVKNLITWTLK